MAGLHRRVIFASGAAVLVLCAAAGGNARAAVGVSASVIPTAALPSSAIRIAAQAGTWGAAIEVPGTAGGASVNSLSCASDGNCWAGGGYASSSGSFQAFVVSEVNGTWGSAQAVAGNLNTGGSADVASVSCVSAGNCAAGGYYFDGSGLQHAFVVSEVNGTWGSAQEVAGSLNVGGGAQVDSVSCASAGNCVAGGYYSDSSPGVVHYQAFVVSEVNGTWGSAQEVPGSFNVGGVAKVNSVSCASAGNCGAGGYYVDGSGNIQAFVVSEVNGTWGSGKEVAGALNVDGSADIASLSCASAGNCAAGGYYHNGSNYQQAFMVSEANGTWGSAQEIAGNLNGVDTSVSSVWCASAGNCAAGGTYTDNSSDQQAFAVNEANGTWDRAQDVAGNLNTGGSADVASVSCASAGNCSAGGTYTDGSGSNQAFVVSQKQPSATALNLSTSALTYGSEDAEHVSVIVSAADTPTGTVTVKAGSTKLCTITLAAGAGSCALAAKVLLPGTHQVTGSYSGDASFGPSVSPPQALRVSKAPSATALNLSASTVTYGDEQAEQMSVTVTSVGTPKGSVTVKAGTTTLCTVTLSAGTGSCWLSDTQLPIGSYQVAGSYSGDSDSSPSVTPPQTLQVDARHFTIEPSANFAGWSVHPSGGTAHSVKAEWKVPEVTCGPKSNGTWYESRAAVWVGMWGPTSHLSTTDWLPQAGTYSRCHFGTYEYELFYELAAANNGFKPVIVTGVNPGDTIEASVTYKGRNSKSQLLFAYSLADLTAQETFHGNMPPTPRGVRLPDAAFQGGVIVENEDRVKACVEQTPLGCLKHAMVGGLAKFASPVSVIEPYAQVDGKELQAYSGYDTLFRWDMIRSKHDPTKLADAGPIMSNGFLVAWKHYF